AYSQIDVALDTYPYHGTTTTCEAMLMGVPTVTRVGPAHASRVGLSLLSAVGLADLAADTDSGYVIAATELAADRQRRLDLRACARGCSRRHWETARPLRESSNRRFRPWRRAGVEVDGRRAVASGGRMQLFSEGRLVIRSRPCATIPPSRRRETSR